MPEYLAPGVFVEEVSFRSKSIEGVSTTTTGFVGPTRYGPLDLEPEIITSLVEFERTYGGREKLGYANAGEVDNYMWHAVRAFFEEGGKRLYVSRVFTPQDETDPWSGHARGGLPGSPSPLAVFARFPGAFGDARVTFTFKMGQSVLVADGSEPGVRSLVSRDVVWIRPSTAGGGSPGAAEGYYLALWDAVNDTWAFSSNGDDLATADVQLAQLTPGAYEMRIVTVTVTVTPLTGSTVPFTSPELPLDPDHERAGSPDGLFDYFSEEPASLSRASTLPIVFREDDVAGFDTGVEVLNAFFNAAPGTGSPATGLQAALEDNDSAPAERSVSIVLSDGDDGNRPQADEYAGVTTPSDRKTGLVAFEDLEDISIVAAPGSTFGYKEADYGPTARTIVRALIRHAERMKYRIAVIDCGDDQTISEVRAMRAQLDSTYGALYYPWIRVLDPLTQREIHVPPSGFVAGIYARNDVNRAVYKAPANEVVNLALGFERFLNKSQQEVLNPEGINCFRYFEGRGMRLWGARTISSDPEWKYVNLRRYFAYVERSIDKGTQWAVFEPNGEKLWANVRRTIEDFLLNEWQNGALLGEKPDKAFFVKCDRSTMSQNDLDNGRLICLVGLAPLKPAEFVIFRIGQWTADRKV
ncbi:phage tail sheath subtilisin-like domain-containing protein [Cupriavidus necator]|uniref:phage tail sheath family protein n=1 Tax=Cupriavidus necator TaxID=106590 RepID=UPI0039C27F61